MTPGKILLLHCILTLLWSTELIFGLESACPVQDQCCSDAGLCPAGSACFDPKAQSCCGLHQGESCGVPPLCNVSTELCALPWYGCDYGGTPRCCPKLDGYGYACSARHLVDCYDNRTTTCCGEALGNPTLCPKDTVCCAGYWLGQCCPANGVCCYNENVQDPSWCCLSGQKCDYENVGNCLNSD